MKLKFDVPDLSGLRELSTLFAARRFLQRAGPTHHEAYGLTMNYIRLVDAAIREYESGRGLLSRFEETTRSTGLNLMLGACSHFEFCIDALRRSVNHLKGIRAHPDVPRSMKTLLPKNLEVLTGTVEGQITGMRHAIQHLEERMGKGEIVRGQPLCLIPEEDGLALGDRKIHFRDLAGWLQELHERAEALANYWEPL